MRKNSDLRLCFGPRGKRPTSQTERPGMQNASQPCSLPTRRQRRHSFSRNFAFFAIFIVSELKPNFYSFSHRRFRTILSQTANSIDTKTAISSGKTKRTHVNNLANECEFYRIMIFRHTIKIDYAFRGFSQKRDIKVIFRKDRLS